MKKLIEALQIFLKYGNPNYPTYCEHDILYININPDLVSQDDINKLAFLGFYADGDDYTQFYSYKFGSA